MRFLPHPPPIHLERFLDMSTSVKESIIEEKPLLTKEYDIKGTRYIVTATVRDGASQDAAASGLSLPLNNIKQGRLVLNKKSRLWNTGR
jgi:hypothetical protein